MLKLAWILKSTDSMDFHKKKYGFPYERLDYLNDVNNTMRLVPALFIMRRLIFVYWALSVKTECVIVYQISSLLSLCLLAHARPFSNDKLGVEVFNEVIAYLFGLFIQSLRGDLFSANDSYNMAWLCCGTLYLYMVYHLGYQFLYKNLKSMSLCVYLKSKARCVKYKHERE